MVNKKNLGALIVPLFFLFLFQAAHICQGQKISKSYVSSNQSSGILYFLKPQEGFKGVKSQELIYDISYLNTADSATFLFSYFDPSERAIDSIGFLINGQWVKHKTKKVFVETKKNLWHYRYSSTVPFSELTSFFAQPSTPPINLYTRQGEVSLKMKKKAWNKLSAINNKIFLVIRHNQ